MNSLFNSFKNSFSNIFGSENFDRDKEALLWERAALLYSKSEQLEVADVIEWMDRIYHAPLHFIYRKIDGNNFLLEHQQVLPTNLLKQGSKKADKKKRGNDIVSMYSGGNSLENTDRFMSSEKAPGFLGTEAKSRLYEMDEKIQNLPKKLQYHQKYEQYGKSNFTIGTVEHFPLKTKDGNLWGFYAVGPDRDLPKLLSDKKAVFTKHLSSWIVQKKESKKEEYLNKWKSDLGPIGVGQFNLNNTASFLLRYLSNKKDIEGTALFEVSNSTTTTIASYHLEEEFINKVTNAIDRSFKNVPNDEATEKKLKQLLNIPDLKDPTILPFYIEDSIAFLFIPKDKATESDSLNTDDADIQLVLSALVDMLNFRPTYGQISNSIVDVYYEMQIAYEQRSDKTKYHTQRVMALSQEFSKAFGLNNTEKRQLLLTAKLHDIGMMGSWIWTSKKTISDDIKHPHIGQKMVENLPIDDLVKKGIATHHERIDGKGTPEGIPGDDIPWTGKMIGLIEFIAEFIEEHQQTNDDEIIEKLSNELINRSESQFDMMLIPTMLEIIQTTGWEKLCALGQEQY
jgi:HD-GYP domain-containing protein (c-di-GMP phosphodiesterase class II)